VIQQNEKRLIEDYLPIVAISAEASREKSVRKGHISTLHLWWARRPLVACRAAVYGALVPASRFVPNAGSDEKKKSLGRANAAKFVERLCQYPGNPAVIAEAQRHILEAHAERLTAELQGRDGSPSRPNSSGAPVEPAPISHRGRALPAWVAEFKFTGDKVTVEDILAGRAPRPRVLDMFAGGGAIPLEALRLGCEAYALDLNPVAHIIELCTLVYPQKYGKPDPTARGMTGPKGKDGQPTWGGLANEVRYWGNWVLEKVKAEIGDLYPLIPDPEFKGQRPEIEFDRVSGQWVIARKGTKIEEFEPPQKTMAFAADAQMNLSASGQSAIRNPKSEIPPGYLMPVAYLWTRTVTCKNPNCRAIVPLVKQTWLCKKPGRYVALKMVADSDEKQACLPRREASRRRQVRFEVVEATSEAGLGFDPAGFSKAGNATCPFCGTVADLDYVKAEGRAGKLGDQMVAMVAAGSGGRGWRYFAADELPEGAVPTTKELDRRLDSFCKTAGITPPLEDIAGKISDDNSLGITVKPYGIRTFKDLFTTRQLLFHLTVAATIRTAQNTMKDAGIEKGCAEALSVFLGSALDRGVDFGCRLCVWNPYKDSGTTHAFGRQTITMVWDYSEVNPLNVGNASWRLGLDRIIDSLQDALFPNPGKVSRGSATQLPYPDGSLDAVVTDPPYYDNVPYSDISDFFYVWLKRSVGNLFPEHFANQNAPKKLEAIADAGRHAGDWDAATAAYEQMMAKSFTEAGRVLKPNGQLAIVYAHKTTLGWSTLVDALRRANFTVTEAWPLDTEFSGRLRSQASAALASSIFLVARKREGAATGNYEEAVKPELEQIVRERVETLWAMGISGADLVIACVGAGLRAFTRFARVEYANGEEVPAERFLSEVETVVLETILEKLSQMVANGMRPNGRIGPTPGLSLAGLDAPTRFYILWRYTYGGADLDAGEAIVFANGTHVELDGPNGLATGRRALLQKSKSKYRLLDYTERGKNEDLGIPDAQSGAAAPLIDTLHRLLWLLEHKPPKIPEFLADAQPNLEQLRLVCQALAGPALKGGELKDVSPTAEQSALGKLLANWSAVMEGEAVRADKRAGQERLL